jgi:hypothetical protein
MEKVMNLAAFGRLGLYWCVVLLTAGMYLAIGVPGSATAAAYKSKQIRVEYVPPKNPAHQPIYEGLKQARALERIQFHHELWGVYPGPRAERTSKDAIATAVWP